MALRPGGLSVDSEAAPGGGGFVTGGTVAADGTKVFRTDTSGAYLYDDTTGRFTQIVPTHLPSSANDFWNGTGVYEAMIAWSDSKTLYVAYDDVLYRSSDAGNSFMPVKSGLKFDSNSGNMRTLERHGQIDPQNPGHVLFADAVAMYRTTDGGATWTTPTGLPAAGSVNGDAAGFSGVAFNPKSPQVNGRSSEAIVSTGGKFFRTTDGGDTWSDISAGGPGTGAEPRAAEFDGMGRYVTSIDPHGLWRYASGAWTNLGTKDQGDTTFVIDPADGNHIAVNNGFNLDFQSSSDGGNTWSAPNWAPVAQQSVDDIPWHTTNPHYYPANVLVDAAHGSYPTVVNDVAKGNFGPSWGLDGSKEDPQMLARWISNGNFAQSGWSIRHADLHHRRPGRAGPGLGRDRLRRRAVRSIRIPAAVTSTGSVPHLFRRMICPLPVSVQ